jgi:hypothetical protein
MAITEIRMAKGDNNYIHRLETENAELKAQLAAIQALITEQQLYFLSPKFQGPDNDYAYLSTDVLPKLSAIKHQAILS